MIERRYIRLRGIVRGPFSRDQLRDELSHGRFGIAYEVSLDKKSWESGRTIAVDLQNEIQRLRPGATSQGTAPSLPELRPEESPPFVPPPPIPSTGFELWMWTTDGYHTPAGVGTLREMRRLVTTGELLPHEFIRASDMAAWTRADECPELSNYWNTERLKRWSRTAAVTGVISLLMSAPTLTYIVYQVAAGNSAFSTLTSICLWISICLAAATLIAATAAYREWKSCFSPRSSETRWLEIGAVTGSATAISVSIVTMALVLMAWWDSPVPRHQSSEPANVHLPSPYSDSQRAI